MNSEGDLGIKVGSKEEKAWRQLHDDAIEQIKTMKRNIIVNEAVARLAEERADLEHQAFLKDEGKA